MVVFRNERVEISQGFFSGWKIIDRQTGAQIKPQKEISEKMGLVWVRVSKRKGYSALVRRACEDALMEMFAEASMLPRGETALKFKGMTPEELIKHIYGED